MKLKKISVIFLLTLFITLVFIIGVRHGERIEKTNKVFNYLISIPPSPTLQPTQTKLEFRTYKHNGCKIQFLHPSFLIKQKTSSQSAKFEGNFQSLEFDCSRNSVDKLLGVKNLATLEVKFDQKNLQARVRPDKRVEKEAGPTLLFNIVHPGTKRNIFVEISKSIFPLFEKSLEFLP